MSIKTEEAKIEDLWSRHSNGDGTMDQLGFPAALAEYKASILAEFEQFADDIPEAYGWGKEDEEADRGYRICSKNVKAELRKKIQTLQAINSLKV